MIPLSAALGFKSWEVQTAATGALGSQVIGGCLQSRETLLNIPKMSRSHSFPKTSCQLLDLLWLRSPRR